MEAPSGILAFTTANYDAMTLFFRVMGFTVRENPGDQFVPLFNGKRGAWVSRHELAFNLEENDDGAPTTGFNLVLFGCKPEEVERLSTLGYTHTTELSLYGTSHHFVSPDGGRVSLCV